ncbi:hypothetical protein QQ020_21420 [Fulvivirgaceae bacterium BMA12]|uniref:Lipoprotein n=1 Tax=Agaribacillus aureus TaxID=3051825 RepID=A0ABT8LA93_9BACT|nr:hypothetical protein [Fulvivirgaceae bacterium BMA12]
MVLTITFFGCKVENQTPQEKSPSRSKIIIDPDNCTPVIDPGLIIENATVEQNQLKLTIRYGGGCGTVENKLLTCGYFMESNPVQLAVALSHKDNDPCKALVKKQLDFDLSPLADLYNINYVEQDRVIILRLSGYDEALRYKF